MNVVQIYFYEKKILALVQQKILINQMIYTLVIHFNQFNLNKAFGDLIFRHY